MVAAPQMHTTELPEPEPTVALVALGVAFSRDAACLDSIRALTARGCRAIAYEDHLDSLPMGLRCLPLIAGAAEVLDSATPDFERELAGWIASALEAETVARAERRRIRRTMGELRIVGESTPMLEIFRTLLRIGPLSELPVLITGETGTGKERLAQAIHLLDPRRRTGPFVAVNCGAISPMLAESELFGHRRGAFTGADRARVGLVRAAQGGVLFLDELGELEPALQAKLLRVIQEGRVLGVGEEQEVPVNVRVVAATNRDLAAMIDAGTFREDLFHRLNVLALRIPPLRERPVDIEPLVAHFIIQHGARLEGGPPPVTRSVFEALSSLALHGNARELENIIRRTLIAKLGRAPIGLADLPAEVWREISERREAAPPPAARGADASTSLPDLFEANSWNLERCLDTCERHLVECALERCDRNQSRTARLLGVTARSVYNKLRKHRLSV
jgi:transcriptional regulator with PAS, ATPase and Fis domain